MNDKILIDQVFYSSGSLGYGILATSLAETSFAQAVVNACLAVGQIPGAGLAKPVLLSRVLGDQIVMARLCNGVKDSSGRNTLFIHALVGTVQEVRSAHISTFSLEDAGVFCDKASEASSRPIMVDAHESVPPRAALPQVPLDFPAAIETPEPDPALMRRIVSGKENVLSWATFAYDDMPGYDVICLSPLASTPAGRNIYNTELKLVRGVTVRRNASAPASPRVDEKSSCLPRQSPMPTKGAREGRNVLLIPMLLSVAINVVLLAVLTFKQTESATRETVIDTKSQYDKIVEAARQNLTGDNEVKDKELDKCGAPIENLYKKNLGEGDYAKKQIQLFEKLLAYKHFVEEFILNQSKEK